MSHIITVSREFGSGGREIGKRLADMLCYAYYDKEIISAIAEKSNFDEGYIETMLDKGLSVHSFPITFRHTFTYSFNAGSSNMTKIMLAQQQILRELASHGDCVIVGRSADAILSDQKPFNIFVYADMPFKLARCIERAQAEEKIDENEMKRLIKQIDNGRAKHHALFSESKWGDKESYHLCVNTSGVEIKTLVPCIAAYASHWFENNDNICPDGK